LHQREEYQHSPVTQFYYYYYYYYYFFIIQPAETFGPDRLFLAAPSFGTNLCSTRIAIANARRSFWLLHPLFANPPAFIQFTCHGQLRLVYHKSVSALLGPFSE
jgi:hypothetical protein